MILERVPAGDCVTRNGIQHRGGEFLPFYIPRELMPQIDEADLPGFLAFAEDRGVRVEATVWPVHDIRPHQRVIREKVRDMPTAALRKPLLLSMEPFILDGHHRWATAAARKLSVMPVDRLILPFEEALDLMFAYPKTYSYGDGQPHPITF